MAGVYANFANVTFSAYEFTITFARIDHEMEEGDIPGVVVSRVNMSQQFFQELLAAMQDSFSKSSRHTCTHPGGSGSWRSVFTNCLKSPRAAAGSRVACNAVQSASAS